MRRPSRPPVAALAAAALLAIVVSAACGVPADDKPRAISREQAPDLDEGDVDTSPAVTEPATLFLTRADPDANHLVPVEEKVPVGSSSTSPTPATALETLLSYMPNDELRAQGYASRIPPNTALASPPQLDDRGVLLVDLNSNIDNVQAEGSQLAFGQIVCTADAFDEVVAVRFQVEGQSRAAPTGGGATTNEPVTCRSYADLMEPASG
ncbi:MAG TPA: GerMN domain-containing protein [Acidimicrobiales bacterium]|jgi:spore germination protein GerM